MFSDTMENMRNPEYQNYICAYWGFSYVGNQLKDYTVSGVKNVYESISCILEGSPICTVQCSKQFGRNINKWCDSCRCWKLHLTKYIRNKNNVAWEKLESWKWPMSYRNIVEVFVPTICAQRTVKFEDLYIESYIWTNCTAFEISSFTIHNLRQLRNTCFAHNATLSLTDTEMARFFDVLQDVLHEPDVKKHINHFECREFLFNIQNKDEFRRNDTIMKILSGMSQWNEKKTKNEEQDIHDVLNPLRGNIDTSFQIHQNIVDSLTTAAARLTSFIFYFLLLCVGLSVLLVLFVNSIRNEWPWISILLIILIVGCLIMFVYLAPVMHLPSLDLIIRWSEYLFLQQLQRTNVRSSKFNNTTAATSDNTGFGPFKDSYFRHEWDRCLILEDIAFMRDLVNYGHLPNREQLKTACQVFSRSSNIINLITDKICETIKRENGKHVWAAYERGKENDIIFVIVMEGSHEYLDSQPEYSIRYRKDGDFSTESRDVILEESDKGLYPDESDISKVRQCINKYTPELTRNHSNITIISASLLKCKGYGTNNCKLERKTCIVLHVHIKGLIPLKESVFPTDLDGIEVDVREGCFQLDSGKGPHDKHQNVKMGCGIRAKEQDDCGTLGGFLEHPEYGLCALTCAHVFFDNTTPTENIRKTFNEDDVECMQPCYEYDNTEGSRFGVLKLMFMGERRSVGLDYALIAVDQNRKPLDGSFPAANIEEWLAAGFKDQSSMTFETGEVVDFKEIIAKRSRRNVVKYGSTTVLTSGILAWHGPTFQENKTTDGLSLKNQIQINLTRSGGKETFSDGGDSGALVFNVDDENNLTAVALLVGGNRKLGFSLATPICDIFEDIKIKNLKRFSVVQHESDNGTMHPSFFLVKSPENNFCQYLRRKIVAALTLLWQPLRSNKEAKQKQN